LITTIAGSSGQNPAEAIASLPVVDSITIGGASGYTANISGVSVIVLRRGGSICLLAGESQVVDLKAWVASFVGVSR